ncbi:hypothetical protein LEP1GSC172_3050 [Leptospira noguchii]|uniref:Uncharacterized protein n=2 Tax=Leptospira noguchii TaxID=28182 RepID=T0FUI5_9LEPT|nr:hypothetical protein LEP1GSC172_3050 [Leptospira noguchii]EQA73944.1 hypothetical protein LEP1GSC059_3921 [Leptospira noguchii serovar Panama str. CZ214]
MSFVELQIITQILVPIPNPKTKRMKKLFFNTLEFINISFIEFFLKF